MMYGRWEGLEMASWPFPQMYVSFVFDTQHHTSVDAALCRPPLSSNDRSGHVFQTLSNHAKLDTILVT